MYVFTSVTLEGWVDVMYALYASYGMNTLVSIYFLLLVVFGSFFVLNLAMAVIMEEYDNASSDQAAQDEQDEKDQAEQDAKDALERENSGIAVDVKEEKEKKGKNKKKGAKKDPLKDKKKTKVFFNFFLPLKGDPPSGGLFLLIPVVT